MADKPKQELELFSVETIESDFSGATDISLEPDPLTEEELEEFLHEYSNDNMLEGLRFISFNGIFHCAIGAAITYIAVYFCGALLLGLIAQIQAQIWIQENLIELSGYPQFAVDAVVAEFIDHKSVLADFDPVVFNSICTGFAGGIFMFYIYHRGWYKFLRLEEYIEHLQKKGV